MENKFAERLSDRRELLRLTRREVAEAVGTNETQIWRYETGKNEPTAEMIYKLTKKLDTTSDYLLGLSEYMEVVGLEEQRVIMRNALFTLYTDRARLDTTESRIVEILVKQDAATKMRFLKMLELLVEQGGSEP